MSTVLILALVALVLALVVYAAVMVGGMVLTRRHVRQHDEFRHRVDDDELDSPLPTDVRY